MENKIQATKEERLRKLANAFDEFCGIVSETELKANPMLTCSIARVNQLLEVRL